MNMNFYMSARIITGRNCIKNNADKFSCLGKKCLIVTGKSSAKKCGALDDVISALNMNKIQFLIYDRICQNPTVSSCLEAGKTAHYEKVDFIIGIGGGSPLDASKAIAVVAANPDIDEDKLYKMQWANNPLPIIAVGTTAGTGSEVTGVSVLTNSKGLKKSFRNDCVYPVFSFGDPEYTMTLPDAFTRSTAVDALAHCVESYFNCNANEISKSFSVSGIKILIKVFDKILKSGTESLTFDDREQLYNASVFGGLAISVTGTAFPHALGYFLTENYGIAHGTACAAFLPEFIEYNSKTVKSVTDEFFKAVQTDEQSFENMIKAVMPAVEVRLNTADIEKLAPRWEGNSGLVRTLGKPDAKFVSEMLAHLF